MNRRLDDMERGIQDLQRKLQIEEAKVKAALETLSPMTGDVTSLKTRVSVIENQLPPGQIQNLNKQLTDIRTVINSIPGVSI